MMMMNSDTSGRFAIEVFNRFSTLFNKEVTRDIVDQAYSTLVKVTEKIALDKLPKKKKRNF